MSLDVTVAVHGPWRVAAAVVAWAVAAVWTSRVLPSIWGVRRVPYLNRLPSDCQPTGSPAVTVVVPAKDEAFAIEATLRSLALQDYGPLQVVAVDDRSTDGTGARMDAVAAEFPARVRALHVDTLPAGWSGKVHAMTRGAEGARSEYLLFTDGDIFFQPDTLRRALTAAVQTGADHFVCLPTLRVHSWDEGMMLAAFHTLGSLAVRAWKVPDPRARRDAVGVGAFNLVRREAFDALGGFGRRPLEMVEDLRLGQDMKAAGFRSVAAFGPGMVQVHWAAGGLGIVRGLTKNLFAALGFHLPLVLLAAVSTVAIFWVPVLGWCVPGMRLASLLSCLMLAISFRLSGPRTGVSGWYGLLSPLGALGVAAALLWSALTTLRQGGVWWRGTFYSLAELRRR